MELKVLCLDILINNKIEHNLPKYFLQVNSCKDYVISRHIYHALRFNEKDINIIIKHLKKDILIKFVYINGLDTVVCRYINNNYPYNSTGYNSYITSVYHRPDYVISEKDISNEKLADKIIKLYNKGIYSFMIKY